MNDTVDPFILEDEFFFDGPSIRHTNFFGPLGKGTAGAMDITKKEWEFHHCCFAEYAAQDQKQIERTFENHSGLATVVGRRLVGDRVCKITVFDFPCGCQIKFIGNQKRIAMCQIPKGLKP